MFGQSNQMQSTTSNNDETETQPNHRQRPRCQI